LVGSVGLKRIMITPKENVDLSIIQNKIQAYTESLFIKIKEKEGFRHT